MQKIVAKANQAVIALKDRELVAFLYSQFKTSPGDTVKLSRKNMIGRFIFSTRSISQKPPEQNIPDGWYPVVVELPKSEFSHNERYFNFYSLERIEMIQDFVKAHFDLYFHTYFFDTTDIATFDCSEYGVSEFTRQMLVDSFVAGINVFDFESLPETIKKRDYRKELNMIRKKRRKFLEKDVVFRKSIYEKRLSDMKSILQ